MAGTTASERLRHKIELLGPGVTLPARLLLEHPRSAELYPRYLATGHHVSRGMIALLQAALKRSRALAAGDPVAAGLAAYLERHLEEETHHEAPGGALLDDLAALGLDGEALVEEAGSPKLDALFALQHELVAERHPVAVLGFLELEAHYTELPLVERLIAATRLPRAGFRQLLLHARLDVVHARELHALLDALPLEPWHEQLIGLSAIMTIGSVAEALAEVGGAFTGSRTAFA